MPSSIEIEAFDPSSYHTKQVNKFHRLVRDLSDVLGPSSGLDSDDVDPMDLQTLMEKYMSNKSDWEIYALRDSSRTFTRNLVDRGNGKSNLVCKAGICRSVTVDIEVDKATQLILVWTPGKESPIHDHANAHCVMKVCRSLDAQKNKKRAHGN